MLTRGRRRPTAAPHPLRRRVEERGAIAVVTALVAALVLFVVAALAVDIGNAWARRGSLQDQADQAAVFAGQYLPAAKTDTKLVAAKAAVWYLSCHRVAGQQDVLAAPMRRAANGSFLCDNPASFDPTSTFYNTAAAAMMTAGYITFPSRFEIRVNTPAATVQFGFAHVVGADHVDESKTATAHVYSPGGVLPMGSSLGCLAGAAAQTGTLGVGSTLDKVLPIDYWSAGSGDPATTSSTGSASLGEPTWGSPPVATGNPAPAVKLPSPGSVPPRAADLAANPPGSLTLSSATLSTSQANLTVAFTADPKIPSAVLPNTVATVPPNLNLTSGTAYAWFRKKTSSGTLEALSAPVTAAAGLASMVVPTTVTSNPGNWYVKVFFAFPTFTKKDVSVKATLGVGGIVLSPAYTATTYTQSGVDFRQSNVSNGKDSSGTTITDGALLLDVAQSGLSDLTNPDNLESCAKPAVSPRLGHVSDSDDMIKNIRLGLDHTIVQNDKIASIAGGFNASSSLGAVATSATTDPSGFAFACKPGDGYSVLDTLPNRDAGPNCVHVNSTTTWSKEFTQGFLTPNGRLSCSVADCDHGVVTLSNYGLAGSYNADDIYDYLTPGAGPSVLNDLLFTSLDTFLTPSVPVATPADAVSSDIYGSPRFFWAPVLTTAYSTKTNSDYPILTFRPSFLTSNPKTLPTAGVTTPVNGVCAEVYARLQALGAGGVNIVKGLTMTIAQLLASTSSNCDVNTVLANLGNQTTREVAGLVLDGSASNVGAGTVLKAVRVMNINPGALPAVDPDYDGPVNDYLGSGPKIIRLVR